VFHLCSICVPFVCQLQPCSFCRWDTGAFRNNAAAAAAAVQGHHRNSAAPVDLRARHHQRRRTPVPAHFGQQWPQQQQEQQQGAYRPPPAFNPEVMLRADAAAAGATDAAAATDAAGASGSTSGWRGAAPVDFNCPITQEPMVDPVILADGHSYERVAIAQYVTASQPANQPASQIDDSQTRSY
jgi:hypothetical protein